MKILMLGAGELGKEVVIELKRYGAYVVAADRYLNAPAQQVADEFCVLDMTDSQALETLLKEVRPDLIVPEIEAIATSVFTSELLNETGSKVVPSRKAVQLTMNREGIRRLAAEELGLETSPYAFASSLEELQKEADKIGYPVVIKPVQSSSGKGQSVAKSAAEIENSWNISQSDARGGGAGVQKVICEGFVDFDYEITLLTCKSSQGIVFCAPIGHLQVDGDYRTSWQPMQMSQVALSRAQQMAQEVVEALTSGDDFDSSVDLGYGVFGVELFVKGDTVIFSEVSPRPHDTGMVTLISGQVSEFAMHARAVLDLPVFEPVLLSASASEAFIGHGDGVPEIHGLRNALQNSQVDVKVFGKPEIHGERRLAVALGRGNDVDDAIANAREACSKLSVEVR